MPKLENILNKKIVRRLFSYYGNRGKRRIEELFGREREKGISAFLGRLLLKAAINIAMNKMGVNEKMRNMFFSLPSNKQTLFNLLFLYSFKASCSFFIIITPKIWI